MYVLLTQQQIAAIQTAFFLRVGGREGIWTVIHHPPPLCICKSKQNILQYITFKIYMLP